MIYHYFAHCIFQAHLRFGWRMEATPGVDVWRCTSRASGARSATIPGTMRTRRWCAVSSASWESRSTPPISPAVRTPSGSTMSNAMATRALSSTAPTMGGGSTTVTIQKMWGSSVRAAQVGTRCSTQDPPPPPPQHCQCWHNYAFWHNFDRFSIKIMLELC